MGNPESKEVSPRSAPTKELRPQNGRSQQKKGEDEVIPYTAFSLPKVPVKPLHGEDDDDEPEEILPVKLPSHNPSPIPSPRGGSSNEFTDPSILELQRLPTIEPLIPHRGKTIGRKFLFGENLTSKYHKLESLPWESMAAELADVWLQSSHTVAKLQREFPPRLKTVEQRVSRVHAQFSVHWQLAGTLRQYSSLISDVQEQLWQMNHLLRDVMQRIVQVEELLPPEIRSTEPLPLPVLTLTQTLTQRADKSAIFSHHNIPHSTRGKTWKRAIGNPLGITSDHYRRYLDHVKMKKETKDPLADKEFFSEIRLIHLDIPRTFPSIEEICSKSSFQFYAELERILEAFMIFRPAVSYAQGMTYLAGMLMLHMDEEDAFVCLCNLMDNHLLASLFKMDLVELQKHLRIFDLLFAENLPSLYDHFNSAGIKPDQYLYQWLSTVFAKEVLPLGMACRVWDSFLPDGELVLYRTALGLLRMFHHKLLASTFEDILQLLKNIPVDINEKELFDHIDAIAVPPYVHTFLTRISGDVKHV